MAPRHESLALELLRAPAQHEPAAAEPGVGCQVASGSRKVEQMEAREFPRAPMTAPVKFFQWDELREAEATEISASGVFLRTKEVLAEGAMVTVRLTLPGLKRAFTVLGKVVRTARGGVFTAPGMGIRFIDIRPTERDAIASYVGRRGLSLVTA